MFLALVSCHYDFCWHLIYTPPSFHFSLEHLFFCSIALSYVGLRTRRLKIKTFYLFYLSFSLVFWVSGVKAGVSVDNRVLWTFLVYFKEQWILNKTIEKYASKICKTQFYWENSFSVGKNKTAISYLWFLKGPVFLSYCRFVVRQKRKSRCPCLFSHYSYVHLDDISSYILHYTSSQFSSKSCKTKSYECMEFANC